MEDSLAEGIFQNRDQILINLHGSYLSCRLSQILGHGTDSRSNLQNHVIFCNSGRTDDLLKHMRVNQEILSEFLLKIKMILLQYFNCILWISKCWFTHTSFYYSFIPSNHKPDEQTAIYVHLA